MRFGTVELRAYVRRECGRRTRRDAGSTRRVISLLFGLVACWFAAAAFGATPQQATSSRAARDEAIRGLPLDKIDPALREQISATVAGASIYRRLPVHVAPCDPDLYLFLVRHPEVVVNIWEVMNISNVALERTGPDTFRAQDGAGTLCQVRMCFASHDTHVIYAEGSYEGPMFNRPVEARCVLVLKSGYMRETDGQYHVTSRMDTFIDIDHAGVELLARTLQLLVHRAADYNFTETAAFLSNVSRTAEANPQGMQRLAGKLSGVEPDVRQQFAELSLTASERARERGAVQASALVPSPRTPERKLPSRRR